MTHSYEDRVNRVTAYIYEHLDEPLDLARLADVAAMSPWHWHRVYSAMRGETVAAAVRRLRLMRAASELANSDEPVEAIAKRSGYDNLQSFTRIFADAYGMPPARYRREGSHTAFNPAQNGAPMPHYDVQIRTLPAMTIATEPHVGDYMNIGRAFDRLFGRLGAAELIDQNTRMFGIYGGDPSAVPVDSALRLPPPSIRHRRICRSPPPVLATMLCSGTRGRTRTCLPSTTGCSAPGCRSPGVRSPMRRCWRNTSTARATPRRRSC